MKYRSSVLAAAFLSVAVLVSGPAKADFKVGNQLYSDCHGKTLVDQGICLGYVTGVADLLGALTGMGWSLGIRVCIPSQVSAQQVIDVVKQHLEKNPSLRHYSATSLITQALSEAWPCPKK